MNTEMVKVGNARLLNGTVYAIAIIMAVISAFTVPGGLTKSVIIAACIALCLVHSFGFPLVDTPRLLAVYFIVQGFIILSVLRLSAPSDVFSLLLYILAIEAVIILPTRYAVAWVAGFYLFACLNAILNQGTGAMIFVFFYAAAFLLTAVFGYALRQAEIARRKNEELLEELKTTQRQLQDLAVTEERNRISREMHDSLGHRLTVTIVQLEGAQRLIPTAPERAARMVGTMRDEMKEALAELRRTVSVMRTPISGDRSFDTTLSTLAQTFQQNTGIPIHFAVTPGFPELPETHQLALYRIAQEALTNIERHAMARNAWMRLSAVDQKVILVMEDDGKGMADLSETRAGSGLLGMRERTAQLGGEMQLVERPGGGTQLILMVPLPKQGISA